jgi:cytidylate kinase
MPGVTISAGYGAGGSVVAPAVAERLGYRLLDRAISSRVAEQLHVSVTEAEAGALKRSLVERFVGVLAPLAGGVIGLGDDPANSAPLPMDDAAEFRRLADAILLDALPRGAVILGRAGAAALRERADVLRVRLFGPDAARVEQAARLEGIDRETAAARLPEVDRARAQYVHRLYGADIDDPSLYHLHIDSTRIPLARCADVIVTAFAALGNTAPY